MGRSASSIRVFFSEDDSELHADFKAMCAKLRLSMTERMVDFVRKDLAHYQQTGRPVDLTNCDCPDLGDDCGKFLKDLATGKKPPNKLIIKLAHKLDIEPEQLVNLVKGVTHDKSVK